MTRMSPTFAFVLLALLMGETATFAQIGQYPGGQYPGGQYPGGRTPGIGGIPLPGRRQQKKTTTSKQDANEQFIDVTGMLRALEEKQVVVEADDSRIINLKRTSKTKFIKDGEDLKPSDLKPGDHLLIEAMQDTEGFFFAVNVILQKPGTEIERANASRQVTVSSQASENNKDSDDERPRLRRADSPPAALNQPSPLRRGRNQSQSPSQRLRNRRKGSPTGRSRRLNAIPMIPDLPPSAAALRRHVYRRRHGKSPAPDSRHRPRPASKRPSKPPLRPFVSRNHRRPKRLRKIPLL